MKHIAFDMKRPDAVAEDDGRLSLAPVALPSLMLLSPCCSLQMGPLLPALMSISAKYEGGGGDFGSTVRYVR